MSSLRFDTAAHAYDRFMGRWSRLFVPAVVEAARIARGDRVLDLAAGTGEGALAAIAAAPDIRVVAVDMSVPMLRAARIKVAGQHVAMAAMDGQALACRSSSFDAAVCMLGLMFFPNPIQGTSELCRVLRRGARAAVCVWPRHDRAPFPGIVLGVLAHHVPDRRAELLSSFSLGDHDQLRAVLAGGGLARVEITSVVRRIIFDGFDDLWEPIATGGARASQALLGLPPAKREAVRDEVRALIAPFEHDGRLVIDVETLIGVGLKD